MQSISPSHDDSRISKYERFRSVSNDIFLQMAIAAESPCAKTPTSQTPLTFHSHILLHRSMCVISGHCWMVCVLQDDCRSVGRHPYPQPPRRRQRSRMGRNVFSPRSRRWPPLHRSRGDLARVRHVGGSCGGRCVDVCKPGEDPRQELSAIHQHVCPVSITVLVFCMRILSFMYKLTEGEYK